MTTEEILLSLEALKAQIEWEFSLEYQIVLEQAMRKLEKEPVLDKIRAEIESCREDEEPHLCDYRYHRNEGLDMALDIIDKYKESEEEE